MHGVRARHVLAAYAASIVCSAAGKIYGAARVLFGAGQILLDFLAFFRYNMM